MSQPSVPETNFNPILAWVEVARKNSTRCNVCLRIARENPKGSEDLKGFKVFRVEFSRESQIAHLARCLGEESAGA